MNETLNPSVEQSQSDSEMNQWEKMAQEVLSEQPRELIEKIESHANESDQTIDKVFDRLGRNTGEGYFEDPSKLVGLVGDAISMTPQEAISNFKASIESYKARSTENYQIRAMTFYEQTKKNVQELSRQGLVGNDTIKVFLNPDYISEVGRGRTMSEYNALQSDFSRREEKSWLTGTQTYERYSMRAKEMADAFAKNGGDVAYQADVPEADTSYDPNKPVIPGNFIHVNSNKPREKGGLRCYISTDKTTDPSAVLYAWKESVQDSPLKDSLYFKFSTSIDYKDGRKQRPDDIVIYKTDNIDDAQFKNLLQDFQHRCNKMSPDLLPHDDRKMPATTQKIANGISIAGEPGYVNDYMRYTDHKEGKHSWTTFVDKMALLSTSVAANRLGVQPDSINTPGLEDETKKVFHEFMLLSKINPDTMLPIEYGNSLPSWTKLENEPISASDELTEKIANEIPSVVDTQEKRSDIAEKSTETEIKPDQNRQKIVSGEMSAIYRIDKENGKTSTMVESEYFDKSEKFSEAHPGLKNNFKLNLAISGLSTDLALIDATNGKNFENGTEQTRANLLEDYSTLRSMLDNPKTSSDEKQLISEYLTTMNGSALAFLESHYSSQQNNNQGKQPDINTNNEEKAESSQDADKKARFEQRLEDTKNNLEKFKGILSDNSAIFDKALSEINELTQDRNKVQDIDLLEYKLNALARANEELQSSAMKFIQENINYESDISSGSNYLSEQKASTERKYVADNEDYVASIARKAGGIDDRISKIRQYISNVHSTLDDLRRW